MAMPFTDLCFAIRLVGDRAVFELTSPGSEAHRAAEFVDAFQFAQFVNNAVWRTGIEFTGISVLQTAYVAGIFNACGLHTEADSEIRHPLLTGVADRIQHSGDSAFTEAARHQDAVVAFELRFIRAIARIFAFEALGFNPGDGQLQIMREGTVNEGFLQRFVRVLIFDIFADDRNRNLIARVVHAMYQVFPLGEIALLHVRREFFVDM